MVDDRVLAYELEIIAEYLVCTIIGHFYLQNVPVIMQSYFLGDLEGQHSLKFVLLGLISCHLPPYKVNLCLSRAELVRIDVLIVAKEFVQLLCEIQRRVVHVDLHLVLIGVLHSEGEDETNLLLWAELWNSFLYE